MAEIDPSQVTSTDYRNPTWVTVTFPNVAQVTEGAYYFLVLQVSQYDSTDHYKVGYDSGAPYPDGMYYPDSYSTGRNDLDMACTITFGE